MTEYLAIAGLWDFIPPKRYPLQYYTIDAFGVSNSKNIGHTDANLWDNIIHVYVRLQLIQLKHQRQKFNIHTKCRGTDLHMHTINKNNILDSLTTRGMRNLYD